jgi:DNA-binding MarR family transcriptional regulator
MSSTEAVFFSLQLTTVFIEHVKISTRLLKARFSLTYNEFVALFALYSAAQPVTVEALGSYLMLRRNTVLPMLLQLENKGLVIKSNAEEDSRIMLITASQDGLTLVSKAAVGLDELLREVFWRALPESDFFQFMRNTIAKSVDLLRGFAVPGFDVAEVRDKLFPCAHYLFWRGMVELWAETTTSISALPFSEYRILELLKEFDTLSPRDIAERLLMQKSGVSVYKAHLLKEGLIVEATDPFDGRRVMLRSTKKGRKVARGIASELDKLVSLIHTTLSSEGVMILNAWYLRMYSNLRTARA